MASLLKCWPTPRTPPNHPRVHTLSAIHRFSNPQLQPHHCLQRKENHAAGASSKTPQSPTTSSPTAAYSRAAGGGDSAAGDGYWGGEAGERGTGAAAAAVAASSTLGLLGKKKPYCLRAHVFQCRGLPSSEASGLLDPYIKVTTYMICVCVVSLGFVGIAGQRCPCCCCCYLFIFFRSRTLLYLASDKHVSGSLHTLLHRTKLCPSEEVTYPLRVQLAAAVISRKIS